MRKIIVIIFVMLIVSSALFYWFQWRPSEIRKSCYKLTQEQAKKEIDKPGDSNITSGMFNNWYRLCLVKNGLHPESLIVDMN